MDKLEELLALPCFSTRDIKLKPQFFLLHKAADRQAISRLLRSKTIQYVVDDFKEQLLELFASRHPSKVYLTDYKKMWAEYLRQLEVSEPLYKQGTWVYYPWLSTVVHLLKDEDFQEVRTMRNRELITQKEQKKYYDAVVGVGGLSVGNSVALAITLQGGARHFRLADFDRLSLSNLNRVRAGVESLGLHKVAVTARQIYALNPYAKIDFFSDGLTPDNVGRFFKGPPKLTVMIDELDNLSVKWLVRKMAKKYRVPIVMGADNGDNAVVDIERYDKEITPSFFHGRMGDVTYEKLRALDKFGIGKHITKHIGPENVTERMQKSLREMGNTIVSWPQLGGAALLNGSAVAYATRKIIIGQPIINNRALISLDEKFVPGYNSSKIQKKRAATATAFKKIFGL